MTEETFDLDRETKIQASVDALGKKWEIKQERGRALYFTRPNPDRSDAVIPKNMQGLWTKIEMLKKEINKYVLETYKTADLADQKAERKRAVAREAIKAKKVTKAKDDTGSTNTEESASA